MRVHRYVESLQLFTEERVHVQLAAMGLDEAAVSMQMQRARKQKECNERTSWDHITTIGYRNRDGQE